MCARIMLTLQAPPEAHMAALLSAFTSSNALTGARMTQAQEEWAKADAYYYKSIARMQRLWEVGGHCIHISLCLFPYHPKTALVPLLHTSIVNQAIATQDVSSPQKCLEEHFGIPE